MSVKAITTQNNFARGKIDRDLNGRFDLPIYSAGAETFTNFISNFKGNALYSPGFEHIYTFQDCAFIEFRFSQNQNYICVLYDNKMRFLSYDVNDDFGWLLNPAPNIYEIDSPYTLEEAKEISFKGSYTQNFDSMEICHRNHPPHALVRTAADTFTLFPSSRQNDPFIGDKAPVKNINGISQATEAVVNVLNHAYIVGTRIFLDGIIGMVELNGYTATVTEVIDANNFKINVDTTEFTAYSGNVGTTAAILNGDNPSVCLYYKSRLYYGSTPKKTTTIWASEAGHYDIFTIPTTALDDSALQFTIAELTSEIEWMIRGQNSLVVGARDSIIAVNGGAVGDPITASSIDTIVASTDGTSSVYPLSKDGFIFYVSNNNNRNLLFFNYDLLSETFQARDANVLSYKITESGITKIRHIKSREDLIFCVKTNGDMISHVFSPPNQEDILGWHLRTTRGTFKDIAQISDNEGTQTLFSLTLRNGQYFIERQARFVEFTERDEFYTNAKSNDDEAFYRRNVEELKKCIYLDNALVYSDFRSTQLVYNNGQITDQSAPFLPENVGNHIVPLWGIGYEHGRFLITEVVNSSTVNVDVLIAPPTDDMPIYYNNGWYLTFSGLSSLGRFSGQEISVVLDGGYYTDFIISGGVIDLGRQATHAVIGYKYRGIIRSFSLGFEFKGHNTQTTMKNITRAGIRFLNSMGGKVGISQYRMNPIQKREQGDLNFLPTLPLNKTHYINFTDEHDRDKSYVIVQEEPAPLHITAVMLEGSHAILW